MIELTDKPGCFVTAPSEPGLARLWALAVSKFGREPATSGDVRAVTEEYHRLLGKNRGSVGEVVAKIARERCPERIGGD